MEATIVKLAEQLPVAVLLALFVILLLDRLSRILEKYSVAQTERDQMMRDFWREQQALSRQTMQALGDLLAAHDRKTDEAISAMKERTRPRGSRGAD